MSEANQSEVLTHKVSGNCIVVQHDRLAVEEPLEIRLGNYVSERRVRKTISITMRTPGDDPELAAGFLFSEGIVRSADDIERIFHSGAPLEQTGTRNTINVDLRAGVSVDLKRLERHFYTTSSCGVCGKTSIDALHAASCPSLPLHGLVVGADVIHQLPGALRAAQAVFDQTGGLHAAALFDAEGSLLALREDVGRHNAVDKLIGAQLLAGHIPLQNSLMMVSGRSSFELVQKGLMAGLPLLAAVGAPSSLAVELAGDFGMTLLGFVRDHRFNAYTGGWRIREVGGMPSESISTTVDVL
jgi:FdhD protein